MKSFVYGLFALGVMGLAFWAYQQNYATQASLKEAEAVREDIAHLRNRLTVLKAEWAYLNRPERLRDLAHLNFDRLGLFPLAPEQFGEVDQVAYPTAEMQPEGVVEVRGTSEEVGG